MALSCGGPAVLGTHQWYTEILICLVASILLLSATPARGGPETYTAAEEYPCVHDMVAAAQDGSHDAQPVYVRTVYKAGNPPAGSMDAHETSHLREHRPQPAFRDLQHRPRQGDAPASLDFTINGATAPEAELEWRPIRIRAFYEDLLNTSRYCTAVGDVRPDYTGNTIPCIAVADVLTEQKRNILMNALVPAAIEMHARRLNVQRVPPGVSLVVSGMGGRWCGSFTVPAAHHTQGVSDADFVVYVAAGPTSTPTSFVAWALGCQSFPGSGRPAVGVIYFNPRYLIDFADETVADIASGGNANSRLDSLIRVAAHELLHAMGFTAAAFRARSLVTTVEGLRGKPRAQVLNTTNVRRAAMAHYGCNDAGSFPGMELEDLDSAGTTSSHWKRRNMRDELMSPVANLMRYSSITLAAMADLGYYTVNEDTAEYLGWGYQVGCALVTEKCIAPTGSPTTPSLFCADTGTSSGSRMCTRDRLSIGRCYITTYSRSLPEHMRYFNSPVTGGGETYVDYCPTVQRYSNAACATGSEAVMPGSAIGDTARCFDVDRTTSLVTKLDFSQQGAVCATVQCNFTTGEYNVRFRGASGFVACPPGTTVDPSEKSADVFQTGGRVQCPSFLDVCSGNTRASFALPPDDRPEGSTNAAAQGVTHTAVRTTLAATIGLLALSCVL